MGSPIGSKEFEASNQKEFAELISKCDLAAGSDCRNRKETEIGKKSFAWCEQCEWCEDVLWSCESYANLLSSCEFLALCARRFQTPCRWAIPLQAEFQNTAMMIMIMSRSCHDGLKTWFYLAKASEREGTLKPFAGSDHVPCPSCCFDSRCWQDFKNLESFLQITILPQKGQQTSDERCRVSWQHIALDFQCLDDGE